ncbi:MAG: hypothetical protein U1F42_01105 [Candidatus Competibacteraceae bacterium]
METDDLRRLGAMNFIRAVAECGRSRDARHKWRIESAALREPIRKLAGIPFAITGACRHPVYPHDGATFEILLQNADATAAYRAQTGGRNRLRFDARMVRKLARRTLLHQELPKR